MSSPLNSSVNRRSFLNLLGLGGVGLVSSSIPGLAKVPTTSAQLPSDWISALGSVSTEYVTFLDNMKLRYLSIFSIMAPHMKQRGAVRNGLPPFDLWKNIAAPLVVADKIAEKLGEKVEEVISAYRSPAYNAACPGAKTHSQHLVNGALDLVFKSSPTEVGKVARSLRSQGVFKGGVGVYRDFTHVDTRGFNADW